MTNSPITPLTTGTRLQQLQVQALVLQGDQLALYRVTDNDLGKEFLLIECLPAMTGVRRSEAGIEVTSPAAAVWQRCREAFEDSARSLARLTHPNIANIIRVFETGNTAYALASWRAGESLASRDAESPRPEINILRREFAGLATALAAVHDSGRTLGYLAPEHLWITDDPGWLILPGISRTAWAEAPDTGTHAPESAQALAPTSDIYGLSACLYKALAGKLPATAAERQAAQAKDQADPLVPLASLVSDGNFLGLADAVDQGLKLEPGQRPQSASHWLQNFQSLDWRLARRGDSGQAQKRTESTPGRARIIIALMALVVVVVVAIVLLQNPREPLTTRVSPTAPDVIMTPETAAQAQQRRAWEVALNADTLKGYRDFLDRWPETIYRQQAQLQIDILDERTWAQLQPEETQAAFEQYLADFPQGLHAPEALQRLERLQREAERLDREARERIAQEQQDWQAASDPATVTSLEQYLATWPAGQHAEQARKLRKTLLDQANEQQAWASASSLDNREAYQRYLDAFPGGEHVAQALAELDARAYRPGKTFRDCPYCPELTVIPAGSFWQGAAASSTAPLDEEMPRRQVTLQHPIAVSSFEITFEQWDACQQAGGCDEEPGDNGWGRGMRPVIMVSWTDAHEYVQWLSNETGARYRLPSESEWEYFARAGEQSDWLGGTAENVCGYANVAGSETGFEWQHAACADPHPLGTLPVGQLKPNDFGLFDVIGNVAEWTNDCMNLSYLDAPQDGSAWTRGLCSSHMARGGSWVTGTKDIRLPARFNLKNGDRNDFTGFRVVREIAND